VIRQAISCDICGTEKKLTNHWFVAYDQGGELRVSGWNSKNRLRPGSKHLCGQTCLHKLVDEFVARTISARVQSAEVRDEKTQERTPATNTSLTSDAAYVEVESSARLLTPPAPALPVRPVYRPPIEMFPAAVKTPVAGPPEQTDEPPIFMSRQWRAEAWERERERETRAAERHTDAGLRRRSS
jgi:hypothetical protein